VPTPRGGGIVIASLVSLALIGTGLLLGDVNSLWLVTAALLVAGISWYDDVRTIGTLPRFLVHSAAIAMVLLAFSPPTLLAMVFGVGISLPMALAVPIAMFWGIALTNVYNFMDGIDGIAGVQAAAAGIGWAGAGFILGSTFLQVAGLVIAASSVGFLFHNWAPARIFMGDVGSAFLGFVFATLPFLAGDVAGGRIPLAAILFVWPFVFDGTFTIVRRLRQRENIFKPHRSHLYQRLVIAGRSHAWVSLLYLAMALFSSGAAIAWLVFGQIGELIAMSALIVVPAVLVTATLISESTSEVHAVLSDA